MDAQSNRRIRRLAGRALALLVGTALAGSMMVSAPLQMTASAQETATQLAEPGDSTITNDQFWYDTDGNPIYSQAGQILDVKDADGSVTHYWYGTYFRGAKDYYANPTGQAQKHDFDYPVEGVVAYSSKDMVNWKNEGLVLSRDEVEKGDVDMPTTNPWTGRMGVYYIEDLGKYAIIISHNALVVALSDSPTGPFVFDRILNMKDYGLSEVYPGDLTGFVDTDGSDYLVYSSPSGRNYTYVAQVGVKDGKVDLVKRKSIYGRSNGREGNCMFKYKGKYYASSSDLFGWDGSHVYWRVADDIWGPYSPEKSYNTMEGAEDFGHVSQTGFYHTLNAGTDKELVIYAGDRWSDFAGNGLGYNVWEPLSFKDDGTPVFNSLSQWNLDAANGTWQVAEQNNYVRNGSFEADRVTVPYTDKDSPKNWMNDFAAWTTTDTKIVTNDSDRSGRVGDRNLKFASTDGNDYSASTSQTIAPTGYPLPDGEYVLSAQYRADAAVQGEAKLTATSGGQEFSVDLKDSTNKSWKEVSVPVTVKGGEVTVSVSVNGKASDVLYVDDIELVSAAGVQSADKTQLAKAVAAVKGLKESDYVASRWQAVASAQSSAQTVLDKADATQDEVNEALKALSIARDGLTSSLLDDYSFESGSQSWIGDGDITRVDTGRKVTADTRVKSHYGRYTWQSAPTDSDGTYALTQTVTLPAGWYELSVHAMGDAYTADGNYLRLALSANDSTLAAQSINLNKSDVWTKTSIKTYFDGGALTVGISGSQKAGTLVAYDDVMLVRTAPGEQTGPDKSALQIVVDAVAELDEQAYTSESWSVLQQAVKTAQSLLADESATQDAIDQAREAVLAAKNALVSSELLSNAGFENGQDPWALTLRNGTKQGSIRVKDANFREGGYSWNSWTNASQDYTLSQTVENLPAGWYELSGWYKGYEGYNNAVSLALCSGEEKLGETKLEMVGDKTWNQGTVKVYLPAAANLTATLDVKADKGEKGWFGAFDDFSLRSVSAPAPDSIEITSLPSKVEYMVGDAFDSTGLAVTGSYTVNGGQTVSMPLGAGDYTVSEPDMSTAGTQTVTVNVGENGPSASFEITVKEKEPEPTPDPDPNPIPGLIEKVISIVTSIVTPIVDFIRNLFPHWTR